MLEILLFYPPTFLIPLARGPPEDMGWFGCGLAMAWRWFGDGLGGSGLMMVWCGLSMVWDQPGARTAILSPTAGGGNEVNFTCFCLRGGRGEGNTWGRGYFWVCVGYVVNNCETIRGRCCRHLFFVCLMFCFLRGEGAWVAIQRK